MATTKNIKWNNGSGYIHVTYSDDGQVSVTSDNNDLSVEREQTIKIKTAIGGKEKSVTIKQRCSVPITISTNIKESSVYFAYTNLNGVSLNVNTSLVGPVSAEVINVNSGSSYTISTAPHWPCNKAFSSWSSGETTSKMTKTALPGGATHQAQFVDKTDTVTYDETKNIDDGKIKILSTPKITFLIPGSNGSAQGELIIDNKWLLYMSSSTVLSVKNLQDSTYNKGGISVIDDAKTLGCPMFLTVGPNKPLHSGCLSLSTKKYAETDPYPMLLISGNGSEYFDSSIALPTGFTSRSFSQTYAFQITYDSSGGLSFKARQIITLNTPYWNYSMVDKDNGQVMIYPWGIYDIPDPTTPLVYIKPSNTGHPTYPNIYRWNHFKDDDSDFQAGLIYKNYMLCTGGSANQGSAKQSFEIFNLQDTRFVTDPETNKQGIQPIYCIMTSDYMAKVGPYYQYNGGPSCKQQLEVGT